MRKYLFFLAFFFVNISYGQLKFNIGVDTLDDDVKAAIRFYDSYLKGFAHKSMPDFSKYWSEEDCKAYTYPDQMLFALSSDGPVYRLLGKPTIIYIKPDKDYINIKTLFADTDSNGISVSCVTNHYITTDKNGQLRFINPIDLNGADWITTVQRNITYHYPSYHRFNQKKADDLIYKIRMLEKDWELKPIKIRYYFARTKEEIQKLRGFDFALNMGNRDKPSGISDDRDNMIYCSGLGEDYFHEVVHIYLNRLHTESPLNEGLAVFYGGSMGHGIEWHISRLSKYLARHPEINLDKNDFNYMDNYTNPTSTIKGMLCMEAYKKDGMDGLKRIMSYTSMEEIYVKEFNVQPGMQDAFIRKLVVDYK